MRLAPANIVGKQEQIVLRLVTRSVFNCDRDFKKVLFLCLRVTRCIAIGRDTRASNSTCPRWEHEKKCSLWNFAPARRRCDYIIRETSVSVAIKRHRNMLNVTGDLLSDTSWKISEKRLSWWSRAKWEVKGERTRVGGGIPLRKIEFQLF